MPIHRRNSKISLRPSRPPHHRRESAQRAMGSRQWTGLQDSRFERSDGKNMNGACGVNTCFANPRRMTGKPAATLLHCGPGLANGLANLHNARRANTPIVNLVGGQATHHRQLDAPLTADTEVWSRPGFAVGQNVSDFTHRWRRCRGRRRSLAAQSRRYSYPHIAIRCLLESGRCCGIAPSRVRRALQVSPDAVAESARLLRSRRQTAIILGGMALRAPQLELASRIAAAAGARLFAPVSNARIERGEGRYPVTRLPYSIDQAVKVLSDVSNVILVGAMRPVAFFAYAAFLQQSCPG